MFIDAHCHIHSHDYPDKEGAYNRAQEANVTKMICVGTTTADSHEAISFSEAHSGVYAAIGVHPHEAKDNQGASRELESVLDQAVAIGEVGLDYYYEHSDRSIQQKVLEEFLQLAQDHKKPVIFHVREAFNDFWPIFENFTNITGVLHSFTDYMKNAEKALSHGLYLGINGIATFTKDIDQVALYRSRPLESILLETDAPYLTPKPLRGTLNEPAYVQLVGTWLSEQTNTPVEEIAQQTTHNATILFNL